MRRLAAAAALWAALSAASAQSVDVPGFYPGNSARWDSIMSESKPIAFEPGLAGIIVPHHMADQGHLAAVWNGVSGVRSPTLIVIFSPDHFTTGCTCATVPLHARYPSPYGTVEVDADLAEAISARGLAERSDAKFMTEHGIFAHTTFIARFFPGVRILPVLLGWDTPRDTLAGIVSAIEERAPREAFFAASVDFSHYVPVEVSRFHDITSTKAVLTMDSEEYYHLEIDSPPSLYVMSALMKARGSGRAVHFFHTQLQEHYPYPISDNTSHLYFAYYPGAPVAVRAASLMIFPESPAGTRPGALVPDTLLDRWPPKNDRGAYVFYPYLAALRGTENRFLKGSDLYIFDLAPSLVLDRTVSGMRVTVAALTAEDPRGRDPERIAELARRCDILVLVDFDPAPAARAQWPALAASGARVIVGRGSGTEAVWRVKDGVLFVDSLGLWQKGGNSPIPSSALGVYVEDGGCRVWDFPLSFYRGYPVLRDMPEADSRTVVRTVPMSRE